MDEQKETAEPVTSYSSSADAEILAASIREFWALKGRSVTVWVVRRNTNKERHYVYDIRSNLVNGLPR